jgi:hypothetical protein
MKNVGRWELWLLVGAIIGMLFGFGICLTEPITLRGVFIELTACTALGACGASILWRCVATWQICRNGGEEPFGDNFTTAQDRPEKDGRGPAKTA